MKKFKMTKKTRLLILSILLFGCIIAVSMIGGMIIEKMKDNNLKLSETVQEQWRSNLKDSLRQTEKHMIDDIYTNKLNIYDRREVQDWVSENVNAVRSNNNYIKNVYVIDTGFTTRSFSETVFNSMIEKYNIDAGSVQYIKDSLQQLNTEELDSIELDMEIIELTKIISKHCNIDGSRVMNLLRSTFFYKNEILLDTATYKTPEERESFYKLFVQYYEHNENNITINGNFGKTEWVEWIVIPDDKLGFDSQQKYNTDGTYNIRYKKLMVVLSLDADYIMEPYGPIMDNVKQLQLLLYSLLVIVLMMSVTIISLKFYNLVKESIGGDANDINCIGHNSDDFNELINIILKKFEEVRK